jgi:hypothetical protein
MSVKRDTIRYGLAAAALAILVIAGAAYYVSTTGVGASSSGISSAQAPTQLVIQLTDPPQVPSGTLWLNMTYSQLSLLVGEPTGVDNQVTTTTIPVTPKGGSATLDLLQLQNVSQTIGAISLPDGSVVYSVTFTVTKVAMNVGGTISNFGLASGSTFTVTLANTPELHGTNTALLRLNPIVVDTSSGYSLIPSSVGVMRQSQGEGQGQVGFNHELTSDEKNDLDHAQASLSANLLVLSVSGTTTTVEVQVQNTGNSPATLNAIGLHGDFMVSSGSTTTTVTTSNQGDHGDNGNGHGYGKDNHQDEVVFVPILPATTTTSTAKGCSALTMQLLNGDLKGDDDGGLNLAPGQCVDLIFSGMISFGESSTVLVPSTSSGQVYQVHIIAIHGGNLQLDCTLPLGTNACVPDQPTD